jgi:DMSO reductase anchor subunit
LRRIALPTGGAFPLLTLVLCLIFRSCAILLLLIAFLAHLIDVLAERWLFFAEARHAMMSYYH